MAQNANANPRCGHRYVDADRVRLPFKGVIVGVPKLTIHFEEKLESGAQPNNKQRAPRTRQRLLKIHFLHKRQKMEKMDLQKTLTRSSTC